jgi:TATA-box binding protein (TBP) (component of TFIID and TFIIIB)
MTTYTEYLEKLSEKERNKKLNKDRFNTFLVFHSGRVIISGLTAQYMKNAYYYFLDIIRACKDEIEEKLDV